MWAKHISAPVYLKSSWMFGIDLVSIDHDEDEAFSVLINIRVSQNKDKNFLPSFFSLAMVYNPYLTPTECLEQHPHCNNAK
jgi:hypothetical protein